MELWLPPIAMAWWAFGAWLIASDRKLDFFDRARYLWLRDVSKDEILDTPNVEHGARFLFWAALWPIYWFRRRRGTR